MTSISVFLTPLTLLFSLIFKPLHITDQSRSQQLLEAKSAALAESSTPTKEDSVNPLENQSPAPILAPATIEGKNICDRLIQVSLKKERK